MMGKDINRVIRNFEREHGVKCVTQECGFGEIVTGFIKGWMYVSVDDNLVNTKTKNAYSHSDIFAVKVIGDDVQKSKVELCEWINNLKDKQVAIRGFYNGYEGVQEQECGKVTYILTRA